MRTDAFRFNLKTDQIICAPPTHTLVAELLVPPVFSSHLCPTVSASFRAFLSLPVDLADPPALRRGHVGVSANIGAD